MASTRESIAGMLRRWLLPTAACAVLLSGCGDDPAPTDASDPDPSLSSSAPSSAPSGAPVQFRIVLASSMAPAPDSQVLQQFKNLDCDAAPVAAAPEEPMAACDDMGVKYALESASIVGGIERASAGIPEGQVGWVVNVELDAEAGDQFADVTDDLVATGGQYALVLDGRVLTAPTIEGRITNGEMQISGNFTEESATALAERLQG